MPAKTNFGKILDKLKGLKPVEGADLPDRSEEDKKGLRLGVGIGSALIMFFLLWWFLNSFKAYALRVEALHSNLGVALFTQNISSKGCWAIGAHLISHSINFKYLPWLAIFSAVFGAALAHRIGYLTKKTAYGQKGDERFTTIKELKQQYPMIPDHDSPVNVREHVPSFPGYGGIPISHIYEHKLSKSFPYVRKKGYYFIDNSNSHNIVIGTSRSGKGQTAVIQMLDVLSRAEKQSSMVVNDPKGELFAAASKTLRQRGYNVYLLNLADGSQSMAYNPLQLIIDKWQQGDKEGAMQLINSLTYTLYHKENAGANSWVYEGAQKAVNGMIIALMEYCIRTNQVQKVTLNNIIDMVDELGTTQYAPDPQDPYTKVNLLDEYFNHLKQGSTAKGEYMSTSFSGEKAKGSIFSTIIQELSMFHMPKMARMTSMNSLDLKSVGFPKFINLDLDRKMQNQRVTVYFLDKQRKVKTKHIVKVSFGGFLQYNFTAHLKSGEYLVIKRKERGQKAQLFTAKLRISQRNPVVKIKTIKNTLGANNVKMHYSDKPTAIFMKIPDYDSSNNALASIFISQLYSELAKQCSFVAGGKTDKRVNFILDEFGNMNPIKDMDQIMTVSAGRNMLFTLIIQSYQQLYSRYGKEKGQTIKENGQNQILIKSTDRDTNREFSELVGKKTVEGRNISKSPMNTTNSINVSADTQPLLTEDRIKDLLESESIVLRPLYREDLHHRRVRPYPIFNHGKTMMPYAWRFLLDEFNPDNNPDMLDIEVPHANLDLATLAINWRDWITWGDDALKAYDEYRQQDEEKSDSMGADSTGTGAATQEAKQPLSADKADEAFSDLYGEDDDEDLDLPAEDDGSEAESEMADVKPIFDFAQKHQRELGENFEEFLRQAASGASYMQLRSFLSDPKLAQELAIVMNEKAKAKQ